MNIFLFMLGWFSAEVIKCLIFGKLSIKHTHKEVVFNCVAGIAIGIVLLITKVAHF